MLESRERVVGADRHLPFTWPHYDQVMLLGREHECAELDRLLAEACAGHSRVQVLRGEPGIGKTALLEHVLAAAEACRVVRIAGVQTEMELPFAGLQQLLAFVPDRLAQLPDHQRAPLAVALGREAGPVPDRFLVGLAVLSLVSELAADQPLVCVIDDAQWLDRASAQALSFVARRLHAESVLMLFAARTPSGDVDQLGGLPELVVEGLSPSAAQQLLTATSGHLDVDVAARLVAESRGNPLALLELPRVHSPERFAGGFGLAPAPDLSAPMERHFRARILRLPAATRSLMLVAAAEPTGDSGLMWRATARLGITPSALLAAEEDGLLSVDSLVRFRHPLVRSASYMSSSAADRRAAHRALADSIDRDDHPDRHAWHLALATVGPDEAVAENLERSAARAQARGGLFATAAFLEKSVELSVDPAQRSRRALSAAQARVLAGSHDAALRMLAIAESGPLDAGARAEARHVRGRVALGVERAGDAAQLLVEAAKLMTPLDASAAQEVYLEALTGAIFLGDHRPGTTVSDVARAALELEPTDESAARWMLEGLARLALDGPSQAGDPIKRALASLTDDDVPSEVALNRMWLGARLAALAWDEQTWAVLGERGSNQARAAGSFIALAAVLSSFGAWFSLSGDLTAAATAEEEASQAWQAVGLPVAPYLRVVNAAWRGDKVPAEQVFVDAEAQFLQRGEGMGLAAVCWARSLLHNGLGHYEMALDQARRAASYPAGMLYSAWALIEQIEAASRVGDMVAAGEALDRLVASTSAAGTDWARGVEARCRALVTSGDAAEALYREAIDHLARTRLKAEAARARLLYGEWLRRERRKHQAAEQLEASHEIFAAMGARAFAARARRELQAAGAHSTSRRSFDGVEALSSQESRIAELAAQGLSNVEIAGTMFISPSTVDYHLRKVFRKLGISSRAKLHLALQERRDPRKPSVP